MNAHQHIIEYIQNVKSAPRKELRYGKLKVSVTLPVHSANVHVAIATALTLSGKISESNTQVTGPSDIA